MTYALEISCLCCTTCYNLSGFIRYSHVATELLIALLLRVITLKSLNVSITIYGRFSEPKV